MNEGASSDYSFLTGTPKVLFIFSQIIKNLTIKMIKMI